MQHDEKDGQNQTAEIPNEQYELGLKQSRDWKFKVRGEKMFSHERKDTHRSR